MLELRRIGMWMAAAALLSACSDPAAEPDGGSDGGAGSSDAGQEPDGGASNAGGDPAAVCDPPTLEGRIEGGAWDSRFSIPGLLGYDGWVPTVRSLAHDADGSLLVAGYFVWVGNQPVNGLARLRTDGTWEAVRSDLPPDLSAVAAGPSGELALASFRPLLPDVSAPPQSGSIFVDTGTGLREIGSFLGIVRALAWVDGRLWVGGHFALDGTSIAELAVWSEADGWSEPPGGPADGPVYALLVEGASVVVGGSFSTIGGISARSVAAWDGSGWSALSMSGFLPEPYGPYAGGAIVFGLARDGEGALYAGGSFVPEGATGGGVARWNGSAWEPVGTGFIDYGGLAGDIPGIVSDVAFHDGHVFVTGCISGTPGAPGTIPNVARWNGTQWEAPPGTMPAAYALSPWYQGYWVCGAEPSGTAILEAPHQRVLGHGERLYVGGFFTELGGVVSQSLIAHDGERWVPQGATGGLGLAGPAVELAVGDPECRVYTLAPPAAIASGPGVFRFDGEAWTALGAGRPEGVTCSELAVSAAGDVYLGCETPWGLVGEPEAPRPRVYRYDGGSWVSLGEIPGVERGSVRDLAFDPAGRLWIIGGFETGFVAVYDGDRVTTFESGFDGLVSTIAFDRNGSGAFVVGGLFTHVGSVAASRIARWDGAAWQPLGEGFDTPPSALAYAADAIYAGTTPGSSLTGDVQWVLARWDGTRWEELGTPERGLAPHVGAESHGTQHQVNVIWVKGDAMVVAGAIYPEGSSATAGGRNVFLFDGERFAPLAGGIGAQRVEGFAPTPDGLWFGGFIATTGGGDQLAPSIGMARFAFAP